MHPIHYALANGTQEASRRSQGVGRRANDLDLFLMGRAEGVDIIGVTHLVKFGWHWTRHVMEGERHSKRRCVEGGCA